MIKINLLPFRAARKKENIRRQVSIFILSLIFAGLVMFFYNSYLSRNIKDLKLKVQDTQEKLNASKKDAALVDEIKGKLDILEKKTNVITSLETNRRAPVELLAALTELIIKERMWFTSLASRSDSVVIKGIATDNKTIADFMIRLQDVGLFSDVKLKSSVHIEFANIKKQLKSFEVNCTKAPPQAKK